MSRATSMFSRVQLVAGLLAVASGWGLDEPPSGARASLRRASRSQGSLAPESLAPLPTPAPAAAASLLHLPKLRLVKSQRGAKMAAGVDSSVDVMIGSGGHGHTFPGATTPWGMVLATPWAHEEGNAWDSQAGFHRPESGGRMSFHGMAHTALSGAGSGEMGELRLLPLGQKDQRIFLSVDSVKGSPGYFSGRAGQGSCEVQMEATATPRAAMHRFTFPQSGSCPGWSQRLVKLALNESPNEFYGFKLKSHELRAAGPNRLEGCSATRNDGIAGADSLLCFVAEFSAPLETPSDVDPDELGSTVLLEFPSNTSSLVAKVAVSRFDLEHARGTLARELGGRSFEEVLQSAQGLWQAALSRVTVDVQPEGRLREFYTALYHSMLAPNLLSEEDGAYRLQRKSQDTAAMHGTAFTVENINQTLPALWAEPGHKVYSTFSLWDTYRSLHPLMNLVQPQVSADFGRSLMKMAELWGNLPPWQLVQSPADMMEGDGGSIVLAAMARDGLLDVNAAFAAIKRARSAVWEGPVGAKKAHSVSHNLEEARADTCAARVAKLLQHEDDAQEFQRRADKMFEDWDEEKKVFKPHGLPSFRRLNVNRIGALDMYTEGTPLMYSFDAEWRLDKLVALHGGPDAFKCALDYFFDRAPLPGGTSADVTGNVHGFTMGNEVDFHVPYLYSLVGRPDRTQALVDQLVKSSFTALSDGLPGNDDLGAMSSWLVFSMLGFYPADVCGQEVALGRPFVSSAALQVQHGTLKLEVHNQGEDNKYVERLTWNGKELDAGRHNATHTPFTLPWSELHKGGELIFHMTAAPPADGPSCSPVA